MPARTAPVYAIFFLSGVAGLGYEIVWTRMFSIGLGHEMPGVLAVVAAFFGGIALGAWGLDGAVSRSRTPGRWYAALEIAIGVWAIASLAVVPALNRAAPVLIGLDPSPLRHWLVAFGVPFAALLPATAAMGATFPAMERLCARLRRSGRTVAGLYAANTAGAVAGTLAATFVVVPALGFSRTLVVMAGVNVLCAAAALAGPARGERERPPVEPEAGERPGDLLLGALVFATGLLGIAYEVLGVRVMGQVLENTVYSFASALSVYLVGTAAGAALYQRFLSRAPFAGALVWLLQGLGVSCLLGIFALHWSASIYETVRERLGGGAAASVAAEMTLALAVFGLPTVLMGATFSHLVQAARRARGGIGRALGLNTLGSALAPPLAGVGLLPAAGAKWALAAVALAYLALLLALSGLRTRQLAPSAAALILVLLLPPRLVLVEAPPGAAITDYREGVMAAVAVVEVPGGGRLLKVNNRFQMGGTVQSFADRRQAHIPLLLHAAPRNALFLGLGTGITAGAATDHPGVEITGVELVPEVVELLGRFAPENHLDRVPAGAYHVADARRFVRAADGRWDVIVADLFHPARDGAGALYTREHFEAVRARLADGGLFCQWLPLYQLDLDMVRLIVRTFLEVFPRANAFIAHFNADSPMPGLVGTTGDTAWGESWYRDRVTDDRLAAALEDVALGNGLTLFGCLLAGSDQLARFAGDGPINTDDRPLVVFDAPYFTYRKDEPGHARLAAIMAECRAAAPDVIAAGTLADRMYARRLDEYLAARDLYLRGRMLMSESRAADGLDLLLESAACADFHTGYVACLEIALELSRTQPERARQLLHRLQEANPEDIRAAQYLKDLFGD